MLKETIAEGLLKEYFLSGVGFSSMLWWSDTDATLLDLILEVIGLRLVALVQCVGWSSGGLERELNEIWASSVFLSWGGFVTNMGEGIGDSEGGRWHGIEGNVFVEVKLFNALDSSDGDSIE